MKFENNYPPSIDTKAERHSECGKCKHLVYEYTFPKCGFFGRGLGALRFSCVVFRCTECLSAYQTKEES